MAAADLCAGAANPMPPRWPGPQNHRTAWFPHQLGFVASNPSRPSTARSSDPTPLPLYGLLPIAPSVRAYVTRQNVNHAFWRSASKCFQSLLQETNTQRRHHAAGNTSPLHCAPRRVAPLLAKPGAANSPLVVRLPHRVANRVHKLHASIGEDQQHLWAEVAGWRWPRLRAAAPPNPHRPSRPRRRRQ